MRELNVNDIEEINGGAIPIAAALAIHLAGNAVSIYSWYSFAKSMK
ncbi:MULTISPECIES: class IIb bacteriocin, lactobin A/cerein 7B family [Pseudoalteromonas]|nr:class IIb bacteriocin, lactobin A/cerein 7B family [Pseudoalteromonas sp. NC201]AUJ70800.1 hypothetical protein PNC201_12675 [Pseudoalteromonas sp. NC201]